MNKALFLDRDGVLDELVRHSNGEWGAPLRAEDVRLLPGVVDSLRTASENGWLLFVVSNQPDAAKEKTTLAALQEAHEAFLALLGGAAIREFFYCYHRAEDRCACRKPEPFFVQQAAGRHEIDLAQSWFVGDADTDVECGRRAGCRTALLQYPQSSNRRGALRPDLTCRDLGHFVRTLIGQPSKHGAQPQR